MKVDKPPPCALSLLCIRLLREIKTTIGWHARVKNSEKQFVNESSLAELFNSDNTQGGYGAMWRQKLTVWGGGRVNEKKGKILKLFRTLQKLRSTSLWFELYAKSTRSCLCMKIKVGAIIGERERNEKKRRKRGENKKMLTPIAFAREPSNNHFSIFRFRGFFCVAFILFSKTKRKNE